MSETEIRSPWKNLLEMFTTRVRKYGDRVALRHKKNGRWNDISWNAWHRDAARFAAALVKLGIKPGEAVSIISGNRPEWAVADFGTLMAGAHLVPLYVTLRPDGIKYILDNADVRAIVVENTAQLDEILAIRTDLPKLLKIAIINGDRPGVPGLVTLERFLASGDDSDPEKLRPLWENEQPGDLATIIYTSGTTGPPKGARISHGNILWVIEAGNHALTASDRDETLSFLPLCHAYERIGGLYAIVSIGGTINFAQSLDTISEDMLEVRPTLLMSVPRLLEKAYARITKMVEESPPAKKAVFNWALGVGRETSPLRCAGKPLSPWQSVRFAIADRLVYRKIKERFGGRLRYAVVAGAPMSRDIEEFFHALDITLLEGYGMTELSAPSHLNRLGQIRFGTVGRALPGVDVKIAEDGEILVRAPNVFLGYHKLPDETADALEGGWMHTGDIGRIDHDGYLYITDRKKDLIITSGGKNIAPQNIENMLRADPFISQAMVYGDKKNYLTALVTIDEENIKAHLAGEKIEVEGPLAQNRAVLDLIHARIEAINKSLPSYETIKKFQVLERDFSQDAGELTPTLKIKRKIITAKYRKALDEMYRD